MSNWAWPWSRQSCLLFSTLQHLMYFLLLESTPYWDFNNADRQTDSRILWKNLLEYWIFKLPTLNVLDINQKSEEWKWTFLNIKNWLEWLISSCLKVLLSDSLTDKWTLEIVVTFAAKKSGHFHEVHYDSRVGWWISKVGENGVKWKLLGIETAVERIFLKNHYFGRGILDPV